MLEVFGLVSNDVIFDTSVIHPFLEDGQILITLGHVGARIGGQNCVKPSSLMYPFDNHGRTIYAHAPGSDDRIMARGHSHATIANQRSGQAGGRIVTLKACRGGTPCTT